MQKYSDEYWMNFALSEARSALVKDEVPIGAILVKDNKIVANKVICFTKRSYKLSSS